MESSYALRECQRKAYEDSFVGLKAHLMSSAHCYITQVT